MKHLNIFVVTFYLKNRKKPPLEVFQLFHEAQWMQIWEDSFEVKISGMTSESLVEMIAEYLQAGERVTVNGVSSAALRVRTLGKKGLGSTKILRFKN